MSKKPTGLADELQIYFLGYANLSKFILHEKLHVRFNDRTFESHDL